MIRCPRMPGLTLAATALLASAAAATVPAVENPAEAPSHETWTLREAWRVGADDPDVLLGQIAVLRGGPDGEVYALDSQLAEIQVFGPGGEFLRTLGREGEGPGEFRQPTNLFWSDDGRIAVQQSFPARVVYLDPLDGTPAGDWQLGRDDPDAGGFAFLRYARDRGGTFAVAAMAARFDQESRQMNENAFLAIVDRDGGERARLSEVASERSLAGFTIDELADHDPSERGLWDVGPDGRVYTVPRYDAYRIDVYGPDGELTTSFARDHEARLRTEQEKDDKRDSMSMNINGIEPEITWKLQDRAAAIDRVRVLDDGTIWILDSHGQDAWEDGGRMTFGVFTPDGRLVRDVTLAAPLAGAGNRLVLLDDGRVMMIKGLDSISINVTAGDGGDEVAPVDNLGDELLELIMFEIER